MFTITHTDGKARAGIFTTAHGKLETPFFMPVATRAVGKCIGSDDYNSMKAQCIISNALVLSMQPGTEIVKKHGGLHTFMDFKGSMFTDCGGFQAGARSMFLKKTKNGLHFRNPFTLSKVVITPERIMQIEHDLGSDVAMVLDDMAPYGSSRAEFEKALSITHRWAEECLRIHKQLRSNDKHRQLLFGIVQGGFYPDLRKQSAEFISSLEFDGIAIGGVAIGEPKKEMYEALDASLPYVDEKKIHYVMGVGSPEDILACVERGVDCFDSVFPTQNARRNTLFTSKGKITIDKQHHKEDLGPIDTDCSCFVCKTYTRAYIHHLSKIDDPVGKRLKSYHNLWFMQRFMEDIRASIKKGTFASFKETFLNTWS